jgi:cobalamin biosynthesis protein CobT
MAPRKTTRNGKGGSKKGNKRNNSLVDIPAATSVPAVANPPVTAGNPPVAASPPNLIADLPANTDHTVDCRVTTDLVANPPANTDLVVNPRVTTELISTAATTDLTAGHHDMEIVSDDSDRDRTYAEESEDEDDEDDEDEGEEGNQIGT